MCQPTLQTLKRQHKELAKVIESLQTKPAGQSPEMQHYQTEYEKISWRITALEQNQSNQSKYPSLLSSLRLGRPKLPKPKAV